ncbi:hypothetical protein [Psychrilyobacter atlanticus]|uniref:hypothetical protein n=1 Tax=Psychrilyobacter atlanticus TaxID=271091 RepID=UPI00041D0F22|nr:hypothetical protein [Psychrilyobacter atlanticus]
MMLKMNDKDFTEMIESAEKFKISSFQTDRSLETINIFANSYVYSFNSPGFDVVSNKDPSKLMEAIIKKINTEAVMGKLLIDLIEKRSGVDLSGQRLITDE